MTPENKYSIIPCVKKGIKRKERYKIYEQINELEKSLESISTESLNPPTP